MTSSRSPICVVVGHVDHGKSSVLDRIRGTSIVDSEAGRITQAIGASIVPMGTIKSICGNLLAAMKINFTIPGLLFIDTPGHAAFTSLRKRGGNIADIAIVVIDINEGFMPQTIESIEILKAYKTPFIIAANKIDLIPGWKSKQGSLLVNLQSQDPKVLRTFETKMYELVGKLSEQGFQAERFDKVEDFTKQVTIVPISAFTNEGIPEMLMMVAGLAQKFLEKRLKVETESYAKGTILEVKEEKGLGKTLDAIIYDGTIKINDILVIAGIDKPIITKIRALLEPAPLTEMRDKKTKFKNVKEAIAAIGIKISAPELDNAIAGMPLKTCSKTDINKISQELMAEIKEVFVETEKEGIIIKADTLGSLEALSVLLKQKGIPVKHAGIGPISKKDIAEAEANIGENILYATILGFNIPPNTLVGRVKIFQNNVIYRLLEDYYSWTKAENEKKESAQLEFLVRPCKLRLIPGYVFRQNNPAVCGVEVLVGKAKAGINLMDVNGQELTTLKAIQKEKENVQIAEENSQVAMSFNRVTIGRNLMEGDILYSNLTEENYRKLKELKKFLNDKEIDVIKEIAAIKRKENPTWGL